MKKGEEEDKRLWKIKEKYAKDDPEKYVHLLKKEAKLDNWFAVGYLLEWYNDYDVRLGQYTKYAIKLQILPDFLMDKYDSHMDDEKWKAVWRVGREIFLRTRYSEHLHDCKITATTQVFCRQLFSECNEKVQACIFTWLLCCKKCGFQKDVAKLIGKIIWKKYRKDLNCWNIFKIEERKRIKRG